MNVLVVNSSHWMSEIGARLAPDCDFAISWYYDHEDKMIKVSLRSFHEAVDVSEIAKEFGGGGHRKAAGFQLAGDLNVDDIFDIEEEEIETISEKAEEIKEEVQVLIKKAEEAGVNVKVDSEENTVVIQDVKIQNENSSE